VGQKLNHFWNFINLTYDDVGRRPIYSGVTAY